MTNLDELKKKIKTRGFWEVIVRPARHVEEPIPELRALLPFVQKLAVQRTGLWGFPHLVDRDPPTRVLRKILGGDQYGDYLYVWRFTQSGQLFHLSGMITDLMSEANFRPVPPRWTPGTWCGVDETIWRFTDVFEFAARFAATDTGTDRIQVHVRVTRLHGRELWLEDQQRVPLRGYTAAASEFPYKKEFDRAELMADTRKLALDAALEMFALFHWDPRPDLIQNYQDQLTRTAAPFR